MTLKISFVQVRGALVVLHYAKNKLDGRQYAVKKIRLKDRSPQVNEKILRFVYSPVKFFYSKLVVALCSCCVPFILFGDHLGERNVNITSSFTSQASFFLYILCIFYLYFYLVWANQVPSTRCILRSTIERVSTCDC